MAARRHVFALTLGIASFTVPFAAFTDTARAEAEQAVPTVPNAKFEFIGKINTNAIPVQSGPGKGGFYSTMRLKKDDTVRIVGIKGEWLKITPPPGSVSYVPSAYVERRADGKVGRVTAESNVRTGSTENALKSTIQTKLEPNTDVKILDDREHEGYYKIEPPEGAYVFVEKKYVDLVDRAPSQKAPEVDVAPTATSQEPKEPQPANLEPKTATGDESDKSNELVTQTPDPKAPGEKSSKAVVAETQPAQPDKTTAALEEFRKLEAEANAAEKLPTIDQPIEQLAERYQALAKDGQLTGTPKAVVAARLKALQMRADVREKLLAFRKSQEDLKDRQKALLAENEEIKQRVNETQVSLYTAVGTLRVSSLQQGNTTLYRLTDPTNGRTVVYIRSNDAKYASLINQFVGVKGDLTNDERMKMKIITPTSAEPVDAAKVNSTIIATITPPGMLISRSAAVDQSETGN